MFPELRGRSFPSKFERHIAQMLCARVRAGEISDLKFQQSVDVGAGIRWKIDFSYVEKGILWYHEAKGVETAEYRMKLKLYRRYGRHPLRVSKGGVNRYKTTEYFPGLREDGRK